MRNTKLYWILQNFDKYEQNRLRKFLQSPYFNRSETITRLFELLITHINEKNEAELEKEHLWKAINLEDSYDDVRFRKYCSDLLKLIESYLSQQIFEVKELLDASFLIEAVRKKKLNKFYPTAVKAAERLTDQNINRSADFYFDQYSIYKIQDLYESEYDRASKRKLEEINNNLDIFYLSEKLRYYCIALDQKYTKNYEYNLELIDQIIDHVRKGNYEDIPAIAIYYQILLIQLEENNIDHYFKLKQLLEKHGLKFPKEEAANMYDLATNYCIDKVNKGNQKFLQELFDLYKDLIKKEVMIVDGELSPWYFKNITVASLRLKEYAWTKDFIDKYQQYLPEAFRQNAVTYNLAQIHFYQKQYDDVKTLLREVEFEDFTYNLGSKSMLLATYYETDEIEPLYSLFDSFRTYLNRHKDIPSLRRQNYANLIKFTKKLTKIIPGDKKSIQKLKQEVENTKNIASYNWLMEKIAELE